MRHILSAILLRPRICQIEIRGIWLKRIVFQFQWIRITVKWCNKNILFSESYFNWKKPHCLQSSFNQIYGFNFLSWRPKKNYIIKMTNFAWAERNKELKIFRSKRWVAWIKIDSNEYKQKLIFHQIELLSFAEIIIIKQINESNSFYKMKSSFV